MSDDLTNINYDFYYLKEYIMGYLRVVDPGTHYILKENEHSFIFITEKNSLFCLNKSFTDSIFFCEVQIDWHKELSFPFIKKDSFNKLDIQELRKYISDNVRSHTEIKDLLNLKTKKNHGDLS